MDKRGAETIVAWVLLVGLSITLGIIVSQWMKEQAEKQSEDIVKEVEGDIKCVDVSLNAYFSDSSCSTLEISNRGYFKILALKIRSDYGTGDPQEINLNPQQTQTLNIGYSVYNGSRIDLIPIIKVGKERLACVDKKISIEC